MNEKLKKGIKVGITLLAGVGTGTVIGMIVKNNIPEGINSVQKVLVGVGTFAVGGVLSNLVTDEWSRQVDEIDNAFAQAMNQYEEEIQKAEDEK